MSGTPWPCECPGSPIDTVPDGSPPCPRYMTQEDLVCDMCRFIDCPTITTQDILNARQFGWLMHIQREMQKS